MKIKIYKSKIENKSGWFTYCITKYGEVDNKTTMNVYFANCQEPDRDPVYIELISAKHGAQKKKVGDAYIDFPNLTVFEYQIAEQPKTSFTPREILNDTDYDVDFY